jgi:hypothetical protein
MEKIRIELESGASRVRFRRPLILTTVSALLITGVFAVLFYTGNPGVEFGQSIAQVESCAYANGNSQMTITPSSTYNVSSTIFNFTGLSEALTPGYTGCENKVITTMFLDQNNAPLTLLNVGGSALTTIEVNNEVGVVNGNTYVGYSDLVSRDDVAFCTTDGQVCYDAKGLSDYLTLTADNTGQSAPADRIVMSFNFVSKIASTDITQVVLQTLGGFTSSLQ